MARQLKDWKESYLYYTSESECPDSFLIWGALLAVGAATQRQVWTEWVYHKFYPNQYVMLVAPPGVAHKNSAIRFIRRMLKAIGISMTSDAVTKEGLIKQMHLRRKNDTEAIAVLANEFATFIAPSGPRMVEFLTDIFDSPVDWEYTTAGKGTQTIPHPYLSMYTAGVPDWVATQFEQQFFTGGFAARTIFIYEEDSRFLKAFANITDEMRQVHTALIEDLAHISTLNGEFIWTEDAKKWFKEWYETEWRLKTLDYRLAGYLGRKPSHILRVAMAIRLTYSDELVLDVPDMKRALALLEHEEPKMEKLFLGIGSNVVNVHLQRIAEEIKAKGQMTKGELIQRNRHALDTRQLDDCIQDLLMMGVIRQIKDTHPPVYIAIE